MREQSGARSVLALKCFSTWGVFGLLSRYLDGTTFNVDQIRFINSIIDELTANGVMDPKRLYESPYTDHAPTGPDALFSGSDVDQLVGILRQVKERALPVDVA